MKNSGQFLRPIDSVPFFDELTDTVRKLGLGRGEFCILGSVALCLRGIRNNRDIDVCVLERSSSRLRGLATKDAKRRGMLSKNIELRSDKYKDTLGLSDEEIVSNPAYHDIVDGFKVVRPEIELIYKLRRSSQQDKLDILDLEAFSTQSNTWDWSLVAILSRKGARVKSNRSLRRWAGRILRLTRAIIRRARYLAEKFKQTVLQGIIPFRNDASRVLVSKIDIGILLGAQIVKSKFLRYDVIVRYLTFQAIDQKHKTYIREYIEMQRLRASVDSYNATVCLLESMKKNGFMSRHPIHISGDGRILDGSHRLACALYLGIEEVPVRIMPWIVASDYGRQWFVDNGFDAKFVSKLDSSLDDLLTWCGVRFVCVLWPPVAAWFDEISTTISNQYRIVWQHDICLKDRFDEFCRSVYACDDIARWKVETKLNVMRSTDNNVRVIVFDLPLPKFRKKGLTDGFLSKRAEELKRQLRSVYSTRLPNYIYDTVCHIGDCPEHNRKILKIIEQYEDLGR